jgi:hypothetical protein
MSTSGCQRKYWQSSVLRPNAFAFWINSSTIRYRKAACRDVDMSPTHDSAATVTAMARTPWHSTESSALPPWVNSND